MILVAEYGFYDSNSVDAGGILHFMASLGLHCFLMTHYGTTKKKKIKLPWDITFLIEAF